VPSVEASAAVLLCLSDKRTLQFAHLTTRCLLFLLNLLPQVRGEPRSCSYNGWQQLNVVLQRLVV
jgi:hypothetical protein